MHEETDNGNTKELSPAELEEEHMLMQQRHIRQNQEREQEKLWQQEIVAAENEKKRQEVERNKRKEVVSLILHFLKLPYITTTLKLLQNKSS